MTIHLDRLNPAALLWAIGAGATLLWTVSLLAEHIPELAVVGAVPLALVGAATHPAMQWPWAKRPLLALGLCLWAYLLPGFGSGCSPQLGVFFLSTSCGSMLFFLAGAMMGTK